MASIMKMSFIAAIMAQGALMPGVFAKAPLSEDVHTETLAPQELGSITSDGYLVYSMNFCTLVQTTNCEVSLSTGVPVPSVESSDDGIGATSNVPYPVPSNENGEPTGETGEPTGDVAEPTGEGSVTAPPGGEPTSPPEEGDEGGSSGYPQPSESTGTGAEPTDDTATESGGPTATDDEDDNGTPTSTAATGDATAGAEILLVGGQEGLVGLVAVAFAFLI